MAQLRTMQWFRWYHGTCDDPEIRHIADVLQTSVANVVATWALILETASENVERGIVPTWNAKKLSYILRIPVDLIEAIHDAMQGELLTGEHITNWTKRQPKREDDSYARVQLHRQQRDTRETMSNAKKRSVTQRNAVKRQETPRVEESRVEESREKKKASSPPLAPKPKKAAAKYPHFPDVVCKAGYDHWIATHGTVTYSRYRQALGPRFTGDPTDPTLEALTNAQTAHKEAMDEMNDKDAGFENIEKFGSRLTHWLRLGMTPYSDEWGVLTERGRLIGSKAANRLLGAFA